jgi:hypothetical protein
MPLPDATKDQRIYQLLKNIDLGNLTFSEFQTAAQSVFAEPEAEDTLRRIVLVNLARMSVAGDWTGLTSSGGGIQYSIVPPDVQSGLSATYGKFAPVQRYSLYTTTVSSGGLEEKLHIFPFTAPKDGTMGAITLRTGGTTTAKDTCNVAIYSSDANGLPATRMGYLELDMNGTAGLYSSSSWDSAPVLVGGNTYWYATGSSGSTPMTTISTRSYNDQLSAMGFTHYPGTGYTALKYDTAHTVPATIDPATELIGAQEPIPVFYFLYA